MEFHSLESISPMELDGFSLPPFIAPSAMRDAKAEPNLLYENDENRIFTSNSVTFDSTYCAPLDSPDGLTYTTLNSASMPQLYSEIAPSFNDGLLTSANSFPFITAPSTPNEPLPSYSATIRQRCSDLASLYDEGIGSSSSPISSLSPPSAENRSERGSIADSDFVEGDRVSPGMHPFFLTGDVRQQCVHCGIAGDCSKEWILDGTGHCLCANCAHLIMTTQPAPPSYSETNPPTNSNKRKKTNTSKQGQKCVNCKTLTTSLWRRDKEGLFVCNACGLYEKLHKCKRPLSMKKDTIQRRKRKTKNADSTTKKTETELPVWQETRPDMKWVFYK